MSGEVDAAPGEADEVGQDVETPVGREAVDDEELEGIVRQRRGNPLEGVDLAKLVQAAVNKTVNKIVGDAVEEMFTEQMREEVSGLALEAAQTKLQPDDPAAANDAAAGTAGAASDSAGEDDAADPPKETIYGSTDEFVRKYLVGMYRRPVGGDHVWAPDWWAFPEAIARLEALWRSWEHLRLDGALGMSVWWKDHADHHMGVLLSSKGPFEVTYGERTEANVPLPYTRPPAGLFPEDTYLEPSLDEPHNDGAAGAPREPVFCGACASQNDPGATACAECGAAV